MPYPPGTLTLPFACIKFLSFAYIDGRVFIAAISIAAANLLILSYIIYYEPGKAIKGLARADRAYHRHLVRPTLLETQVDLLPSLITSPAALL